MANNPEYVDAEWASELVKRVGAQVKVRRKGRSAKWLSERTAELGYRISPTVIAKLDSGHRGDVLSVAEWLVLGAALDVPPILLLYPDMPDGLVDMLPGVPRPSSWAAAWIQGDMTELDSWTILPEGTQIDDDARKIIELTRERAYVNAQIRAAKELLGEGLPDNRVTQVLEQITQARKRIRELDDLLRIYGATVDEARSDGDA